MRKFNVLIADTIHTEEVSWVEASRLANDLFAAGEQMVSIEEVEDE